MAPKTKAELREYVVVKSNDIIQKSRFDLSLQEQRIILYLVSKIKPSDTELKEHVFEIKDFCTVCGIDKDNGKNYKNVKQALKELRDKSIWMMTEDGGETTLSWIDKITIYQHNGKVIIKIDEMMKPYLIQLKERFTQYELLYTLAMKSQYSIRLYELLKSYEYQHEKKFDLDAFKKLVSAEKYKQLCELKKNVLEIATREINSVSDINVSYKLIKQGRKFSEIQFYIEKKKSIDKRLSTWANIEKIIDS